jgi:hypothetical protein
VPLNPEDVNAMTADLLSQVGLKQRHPLPENETGEQLVDTMLAADQYEQAKSDEAAKARGKISGFFRVTNADDGSPVPSCPPADFMRDWALTPLTPQEIQRNMDALYRKLGKVDIHGKPIQREPRRDRRR